MQETQRQQTHLRREAGRFPITQHHNKKALVREADAVPERHKITLGDEVRHRRRRGVSQEAQHFVVRVKPLQVRDLQTANAEGEPST